MSYFCRNLRLLLLDGAKKVETMKALFLLLYIFLFLSVFKAQTYLDSKHYLVDSIAINSITNEELILIDSCIDQYYIENNDTAKINVVNTIVSESWNINVWPKYNDWILDISSKKLKEVKEEKLLNYYRLIVSQCYNNKGFYLEKIDDQEAALEYYIKALKLLRVLKDDENSAYILLNIGSIYDDFGDLIKSLEYYNKALSSFITTDDKTGISSAYNNLGMTYSGLKDYNTAMRYFKKALVIQDELSDKYNLATTYGNIGNIHFAKGNTAEALLNYQKSLKLSKQIKNYQGIATNLSQKAKCYFELGDYSTSLELNLEALHIRDSINHKSGITYSYLSLSENYFKTNKIQLAQSYGEKALVKAKALGYPALISASSKLLSQIYEKTNKTSKAFELYKFHIKMRDSLQNDKIQKQKIEQEISFVFEKKQELFQARVARQNENNQEKYNKKIEAEKQEIEKQQLISYFIASGLFIVSLFFVFIFNRLKISRKQTETIEKQKLIVEKQKLTLEDTHSELNSSIDYAKYLQDALLPDTQVIKNSFSDSFILNKPKNIVSGDFYWFKNRNNVKYIAVADCTGHGVPGAMVSVVCSNALDRALTEFNLSSPSAILSKAKEIIINTLSKNGKGMKDGMDIVLCAFSDGKVYFSGAVNPFWLVRQTKNITQFQKENCTILNSKNNELALIEYKSIRRNVGFSYDIKEIPFKEYVLELCSEDAIYLFSDGYVDQFGGGKMKKFKQLAFKKLLLDVNHLPMDEQNIIIDDTFEKWKGNMFQVDDVCVLGLNP